MARMPVGRVERKLARSEWWRRCGIVVEVVLTWFKVASSWSLSPWCGITECRGYGTCGVVCVIWWRGEWAWG